MPPAQGDTYATDVEEDDVDECHKNNFLPNDVAGTLEVHNNDECEVASDVSAVQSKENKPPPKKKNAKAVLWKKKSSLKEIPEANIMRLADSHPHPSLLEPVALFRLLFNEIICSLIACKTERYGSQRNEVIHLTPQEIEAFVGILLLTGYNSRPRQRLYWSKDDDISCPLITRSMSRKRFEDIKKLIHFADNNNLPAGDKLAKIRPLQDRVNASLQQFGVFAKDLAIHEQMVPYFGRHSAKMFIRGKPIRFGYKNWVLASSDGYPYKFETYTGACDTKDSSKPLGPQVVSALLSIVENPACHCVYFDNFLHLILYCEICTKIILGLLRLYVKAVQ